jgi:S-adenosylmethionine hydrolase
VSSTFHGRDLFAPVAAALSSGIAAAEFGPQLADCVRLKPLEPKLLRNGKVQGRIIHIDRFGNCVTNLQEEHLGQDQVSLQVNGRRITSMRRFYAEEVKSRSKLFAIKGSAGFIEISARNASAAKILKARRGQTVRVL